MVVHHPFVLTAFATWLLVAVVITSAVLNYAITNVASAHEDLLQALCTESGLDFVSPQPVFLNN